MRANPEYVELSESTVRWLAGLAGVSLRKVKTGLGDIVCCEPNAANNGFICKDQSGQPVWAGSGQTFPPGLPRCAPGQVILPGLIPPSALPPQPAPFHPLGPLPPVQVPLPFMNPQPLPVGLPIQITWPPPNGNAPAQAPAPAPAPAPQPPPAGQQPPPAPPPVRPAPRPLPPIPIVIIRPGFPAPVDVATVARLLAIAEEAVEAADAIRLRARRCSATEEDRARARQVGLCAEAYTRAAGALRPVVQELCLAKSQGRPAMLREPQVRALEDLSRCVSNFTKAASSAFEAQAAGLPAAPGGGSGRGLLDVLVGVGLPAVAAAAVAL